MITGGVEARPARDILSLAVLAGILKSRLVPRPLRIVLLLGLLTACAVAQVQFQVLDREVIEARLEGFSRKNDEREAILKQMFVQSGCKDDKLSEQTVKKKLPPNLICVLPGDTNAIILVGAHSDHVEVGDGVVDNWSGASLLPSLYYSLSKVPRKHTFVFVNFTAEEKGLVGSDFYAGKLSPEQRSKIEAMINMDTLGLGPTEVWATHADTTLLNALAGVANAMKLPVSVMNVDQVGSSDSESFAKYKIPRITIHSVTQQTWPILHSSKDKLNEIKKDDYYASYRLMIGYLAFLDTDLGRPATAQANTGH
ncbi:MAG: Zn-dependent exopeptidase M28 [Acidobacteriia bacterium]|nr:Zn-dependent exopeptidase M28 [Terriglobia bacterium]